MLLRYLPTLVVYAPMLSPYAGGLCSYNISLRSARYHPTLCLRPARYLSRLSAYAMCLVCCTCCLPMPAISLGRVVAP
eukprot:1968680-Rhodomonas_salina.1